MAVLDLIRVFISSLLGMLIHSSRLPGRSWRSDLMCRFTRKLVHESIAHDVSWMRKRQDLLKLYHPALKQVRFRKEVLANVPCQWCEAKGLSQTAAQESPLMLYFHGGGYVIGNVQGYRTEIAAMAVAGNCTVLGVDYRLAPEHPLPAAQQDCLAVTRHILERFPNRKILLAGDSAGGALCLATIMALREQGQNVKGAVLLSPWCEPGVRDRSMQENAGSDILSQQLTEHWFNYALADVPLEQVKPQVDFSETNFTGFPPLYIQAASGEVLLDQIERMVQRAREQGVDVEYSREEGQFHVFQIFAPIVPEANDAIERLGTAIKTIINKRG
ncbi:alpha/beta hydrolase [Aestuariirhabdus sp. Z084]|uniref:alpha/beta hydrolase n=1 Tax=Aestuariirhabdus haliotis TaxID=2918751 RepID=UPI00201B357E|nr:alpha/beta hydrolase [Aestuariirhabdus haliotis]MCL6416424.1 alpha/beta hydrolase [Aestuariirhabdus haliotis]MCL6420410.1 alpha/beta hydrolase [Aestuariirhabdus haliotis]